jgi:hypothetical protein
MKTQSDIYFEGDSYFSFADASPLIGLEGYYLIHAEGNSRVLFKIFLEYKSEITGRGNVYFMLKKLKYFKNHCEPVEGYDGLYKYTGE